VYCICYLGVGDTEHALYVAILLCSLEDRDIELPILLHTLGVTSGPVLVANLLQSRLLTLSPLGTPRNMAINAILCCVI